MLNLFRKDPEITNQDKLLLKEMVVGTDGPGSILHDFQVMLDYTIENKPTVTKNHQLRLQALSSLNDQMKRPIQHGLTRPQQKSFPHINGQYLILRASGLTFVKTTGKTPRLIVDASTLQSWQQLNPTERYFTLLESWLLRGTDDILGNWRGGFSSWHNVPLGRCIDFFLHLPQEGFNATTDADAIDRLRYFPELHNLAMLELFGMVAIEDRPAVEKEGWQIESVRSTPLGTAMLKLLMKVFADSSLMFDLDPSEVHPGTLQSVFQPYFPEWQNNLQWPKHTFRSGLYIFKVYVFEDVWRRIAIPAKFSLEFLGSVILKAFDFDNDHLHRFIYKTRLGTEKSFYHPYMDEGPFTSEVLVGDVPLEVGSSMSFNFDFGDNWYFLVTLERIDNDMTTNKAAVLESYGEAPLQYPHYDDEW